MSPFGHLANLVWQFRRAGMFYSVVSNASMELAWVQMGARLSTGGSAFPPLSREGALRPRGPLEGTYNTGGPLYKYWTRYLVPKSPQYFPMERFLKPAFLLPISFLRHGSYHPRRTCITSMFQALQGKD